MISPEDNNRSDRKIVFVNRYFFPDHSATSQLVSDLAFHIAAQGVAVSVVTSAQVYDDPAVRLPRQERIRGVEIRRVWTTRFGRGKLFGRLIDYFTFYLSAAWALLRLLRRGDTVVAKTDPPLISVVAAVAARLRGAMLVNWVQDLFPEIAVALKVRAVQVLEPLLRAIRNYSLQVAASNIAIGTQMARRIIEQGVQSGQVTVIHNWSSAEELRPLATEDVELRKEWGLGGRFVVGYSGNMGRAHNFDTVLEAARLLIDLPEVIFLFIGSGAQRAQLEAEVAKRRLSNVVFKPYQPFEMLKQSLCVPDVHLISLQPELEGYIVPSKFYGIVAAGRAVIYIGRRDGEIAHLVDKAGCGVTVSPDDGAQLAATVRRLAADRDHCLVLGARARGTYERHFDRALALDRWTRVLVPDYRGIEYKDIPVQIKVSENGIPQHRAPDPSSLRHTSVI